MVVPVSEKPRSSAVAGTPPSTPDIRRTPRVTATMMTAVTTSGTTTLATIHQSMGPPSRLHGAYRDKPDERAPFVSGARG